MVNELDTDGDYSDSVLAELMQFVPRVIHVDLCHTRILQNNCSTL